MHQKLKQKQIKLTSSICIIENGQLSADELSAIANGADIDFILTVKDGF